MRNKPLELNSCSFLNKIKVFNAILNFNKRNECIFLYLEKY